MLQVLLKEIVSKFNKYDYLPLTTNVAVVFAPPSARHLYSPPSFQATFRIVNECTGPFA
jgi:hypothetical protein